MRAFLRLAGTLVLVVVLGLSAVAKLVDTTEAVGAFSDLGLPEGMVGPAVIGVTAAELLVAAALLVPALRHYAAKVSVIFFITLAGATLWLTRSGAGHDCGCLGTIAQGRIDWVAAVQDIILAGVAIVVASGNRRHKGIAR